MQGPSASGHFNPFEIRPAEQENMHRQNQQNQQQQQQQQYYEQQQYQYSQQQYPQQAYDQHQQQQYAQQYYQQQQQDQLYQQQQQQQQYYDKQALHQQLYDPQHSQRQPAPVEHFQDMDRSDEVPSRLNASSVTPLQHGSKTASLHRRFSSTVAVSSSSPWSKVERYLCCCCPKNKTHRIICIVVTLLILIALGVVAYIYIPRYPQITVNTIDLSSIGKSNSPYSFTVKKEGDLNTLNFQMNLTMNLMAYNPNAYDFNVDQISLVARMMVNSSVVNDPLQTSPLTSFASLAQMIKPPSNTDGYVGLTNAVVGTSSHGSIVFPAKTTVNFTMVFLLSYSPDQKLGLLNDPTIKEIASACGITDRRSRSRPMRIHYDADSMIGALKPLGFVPQISNDLRINCPFSQSQISAVVTKVQQGSSIMDALSQVFEGGAAGPPPELNPTPPPPPQDTSSESTPARSSASEAVDGRSVASTTVGRQNGDNFDIPAATTTGSRVAPSTGNGFTIETIVPDPEQSVSSMETATSTEIVRPISTGIAVVTSAATGNGGDTRPDQTGAGGSPATSESGQLSRQNGGSILNPGNISSLVNVKFRR
ncbi:hypothetical protein CcCBS67573_g00364 [Chytriomyces confervae]|uniref:Late embryogenesis abundant protein LEA-2 subgroup domain-containing protein n=1 Tax=Chytriomyces confervae TaxID=246404 RepID=A0A507FPI2_9FUNG|nr:hypothetical protein HDU80_006800 [Chytriomyces hyalinus]TPX78341.1 hypothetical protein CcCBS67573_g00364 [Chytriomyces confervae]